jgi:hypothetical protein
MASVRIQFAFGLSKTLPVRRHNQRGMRGIQMELG